MTDKLATPLTDAESKKYLGHSEVTADFARSMERDRAMLREALVLVTDALNDPGVGDHEQWKRDCRIATIKARAALAATEAA